MAVVEEELAGVALAADPVAVLCAPPVCCCCWLDELEALAEAADDEEDEDDDATFAIIFAREFEIQRSEALMHSPVPVLCFLASLFLSFCLCLLVPSNICLELV